MTQKVKMQEDAGGTIGDLRNFYISKSYSTPSLKRQPLSRIWCDYTGPPIRHMLYPPFLYPMRFNFFHIFHLLSLYLLCIYLTLSIYCMCVWRELKLIFQFINHLLSFSFLSWFTAV